MDIPPTYTGKRYSQDNIIEQKLANNLTRSFCNIHVRETVDNILKTGIDIEKQS